MEQDPKLQNLDKKIDDILEIVQFIKDNSASKDDIKDMATKDDIKNMATKDDIVRLEAKMDQGFADIRSELRSISSELEEIKRDLKKLEARTQVDDDVMIADNFKLRRRVEKLEKQVKFLIMSRAQ